MKRWIAGLLALAVPAASAAPPSLCTGGEQLKFGCKIARSNKILSICASPDLSAERGYLQYRYGLPRKVELTFPAARDGTQAQFQFSVYTRPLVSYEALSFSRQGVRYEVFSDYNSEGDEEQMSEGVRVTLATGDERLFECINRASGSLLDLQYVVPALPDSP